MMSESTTDPSTDTPVTSKTTNHHKPTPTNDHATYTPRHPIPSIAEVLERYPAITDIHPACSALPDMPANSFDDLVDAIDKAGQLDAIKVDPDGQLLDGRFRLSACFVLGIEPRIERSTDDPWAIAKSNVARRHLEPGQRAAFAARYLGVERAAAKQRQQAGLRKGSEKPVRQNSDKRAGRALQLAGEMAGVSHDTVRKFVKLPEPLQEAVAAGRQTVNAAAIKAGIVKPRPTARRAKAKADNVGPAPDNVATEPKTSDGDQHDKQDDAPAVLSHPGTSVSAFVYRHGSAQWRYMLSTMKISRRAASREQAIATVTSKLAALARTAMARDPDESP